MRWKLLWGRGDYFQFGSIFIKKNNQTDFFLKKPKSVQTEIGSNRPVLVQFFRTKTV
jgi:hypothetical protein